MKLRELPIKGEFIAFGVVAYNHNGSYYVYDATERRLYVAPVQDLHIQEFEERSDEIFIAAVLDYAKTKGFYATKGYTFQDFIDPHKQPPVWWEGGIK